MSAADDAHEDRRRAGAERVSLNHALRIRCRCRRVTSSCGLRVVSGVVPRRTPADENSAESRAALTARKKAELPGYMDAMGGEGAIPTVDSSRLLQVG